MMLWSTTHRKQQGNALILVVFIIVVVGFVALVANRNQARSSQQLVYGAWYSRGNGRPLGT